MVEEDSKSRVKTATEKSIVRPSASAGAAGAATVLQRSRVSTMSSLRKRCVFLILRHRFSPKIPIPVVRTRPKEMERTSTWVAAAVGTAAAVAQSSPSEPMLSSPH